MLFTLLLFYGFSASACSLAIHDWKLICYLKIPVSAPLFPLAEFNLLSTNFKEAPGKNVLWLSQHGQVGSFLSGFIHALPGWPAKTSWLLSNSNKSVISHAMTESGANSRPLIIGSDKNFIKLALFSDRNSNYSCHQIVILHSNRIRGVMASKDAPWAMETNGMAWVSVIFYQVPIPGRILSVSIFPFRATRQSIFEDHAYVENLLAEKLLKRRPDLELDPYSFDFPELPK